MAAREGKLLQNPITSGTGSGVGPANYEYEALFEWHGMGKLVGPFRPFLMAKMDHFGRFWGDFSNTRADFATQLGPVDPGRRSEMDLWHLQLLTLPYRSKKVERKIRF